MLRKSLQGAKGLYNGQSAGCKSIYNDYPAGSEGKIKSYRSRASNIEVGETPLNRSAEQLTLIY